MTFREFVGEGSTGIIGIINTAIVPLLLSLAFFYFVWNAVQYFFIQGNNEKKRIEGRQFVMWGILGLVVLFSVWAIVKLALSTLGIAPR